MNKIGNIDEIYGLAYFDDVDYSVRAINAGFLVVVALDTYVYHHRNVTFFEVLKGKKWNELHEKNRLIYYKKWGKPLRIAIILDRRLCGDRALLDRARDTVYYLARKQHRIDIWSPCSLAGEFSHTNVSFKAYNPLIIKLAAFIELYFNSKKKAEKRYDAVFSFEKRSSGNDYDAFIRARVDALKEKTKEMY